MNRIIALLLSLLFCCANPILAQGAQVVIPGYNPPQENAAAPTQGNAVTAPNATAQGMQNATPPAPTPQMQLAPSNQISQMAKTAQAPQNGGPNANAGPNAAVFQNLFQQGQTQPTDLTPSTGYPDITSQAVILVFLAMLPFIIMLLTSFMKMVITLTLLRSALGVQQTPPNQVINGIALILTVYVMYPTGMEMYRRSEHLLKDAPTQLISLPSAALTLEVIDVAKEPLRDFLIRNSTKTNIDGFHSLAMKTFPPEAQASLKATDFIVVIPAFITSQIKAAFEIGVLIYLPFFVIDLVTSNVLLAMQMMMLSPLSISLPLKLLLMVMMNGWTILVQGLVLSFN